MTTKHDHEEDGTAIEQQTTDLRALRGVFGLCAGTLTAATVSAASTVLPVAAVEAGMLLSLTILAYGSVEIATTDGALSIAKRAERAIGGVK